MRHFLLPRTVATLAFGVSVTSPQGGLVTLSGRVLLALARGLRTGVITVAVAAIAVAANHHRLAAPGAQVTSSRDLHGRTQAMGLDRNARFVTYSACNVARWRRARHRF